jgi:putative transposase
MPAARIFFQLIADFVVYLGLLIRPRKAIAAENLFLRLQLALYQERKVGPRRIDPAYARYVGSALKVIQLARCAHCGSTEDVDFAGIEPGFDFCGIGNQNRGAPPIPAELRRLIREMSRDDSLRGEERIANELLVKLGIRVSPRTGPNWCRKMNGVRSKSRLTGIFDIPVERQNG